MSKPMTIEDANFDEVVLQAKTLMLVDFWAPWCGPCRMVAPVVEELANEYEGKVGFGKVTPTQVVRTVLAEDEPGIDAPPATEERSASTLGRLLDKVRGRSHSGIRVQGEGDVLVRFAHCCNPLPGDAITGFITRGRGVTIHKLTCSKALDLDPVPVGVMEHDGAHPQVGVDGIVDSDALGSQPPHEGIDIRDEEGERELPRKVPGHIHV